MRRGGELGSGALVELEGRTARPKPHPQRTALGTVSHEGTLWQKCVRVSRDMCVPLGFGYAVMLLWPSPPANTAPARGTARSTMQNHATMKPHDHLSCNWTAYRRALLPSPERDALLHRVASQLPTDGCYAAATVATEVAGLHSLVQRALQAYARSSGVPKPTTVRLFVTLSDAASERTGGLCTPTLPPRLGSEGFIRGTMLISGPTHRIHWWQPHPAAAVAADATSAEQRTTLLEPGGLLLHHTSLRYRAEPAVAPQSAGASLWLRFLVWATLPEPGAPRPKGGPPTPRFRDALLVPFRSPAHVEPPPPLADARGAAFAGRGPAEAARRALWAQVWRAGRDARPGPSQPSLTAAVRRARPPLLR